MMPDDRKVRVSKVSLHQLHLQWLGKQFSLAYPKGALYHRHLDSYDGKDIPRLLVRLT